MTRLVTNPETNPVTESVPQKSRRTLQLVTPTALRPNRRDHVASALLQTIHGLSQSLRCAYLWRLVETPSVQISGSLPQRSGLVGQGPIFRTYCTHPLGNDAPNTEAKSQSAEQAISQKAPSRMS